MFLKVSFIEFDSVFKSEENFSSKLSYPGTLGTIFSHFNLNIQMSLILNVVNSFINKSHSEAVILVSMLVKCNLMFTFDFCNHLA